MTSLVTNKPIGISGLAAYIPPYRVWLEDWCDWTDNQWPKVREVVGRSFRVRGRVASVIEPGLQLLLFSIQILVLVDARLQLGILFLKTFTGA